MDNLEEAKRKLDAAAETVQRTESYVRSIRYPDPTPEDLKSPEFIAVWSVIRGWDISRENPTDGNRMYSGATGNDVMAILNALKALK